MTIAVDKKGAVVGQVTATGYQNDQYGRAFGPLGYRLLTAAGYIFVPAASVRVEEVR